ncbi:unnamed protein product [Allacma fusca]|uniref:C2H2-type domain-containing protein n=1 Tax=Allacma fusca TaxID=39272 RepID=A0A8J2LAF9_9HEXA|nr:unnamed protein product [Allacma fusca]
MAREPPPKRLDQCANCCVPVGVRITDDSGKVDMSKTSSDCQAKVSAFIINADGRQNKIRVTDALNEMFPNISKILRASAEGDLNVGEEQHRGNISVRSDIFEPESVFKEPFLESLGDGATGSSVPTFYLEPARVTTQNKGRPLSSLYINPDGTDCMDDPDYEGEESNFEFKFAGKAQRQYSKGTQGRGGGAKGNTTIFPLQSFRTKKIPQASTSSKINPRVPQVLVVKKSVSGGFMGGVRPKVVPQQARLQFKNCKMGGNWNNSPSSVGGESRTEQAVVKEEPLEEIPLQHFLVPSSDPMKRVNSSESHQCPNCFRPFNSEFLLKCHREYCRSAEEIRDLIPTRKAKCPVCAKVFGDAKALLEHIRLKHRVVRHHSCQSCDLNFKSEKNLIAHNMKVHKTSGVSNAPVKCEDCELKFTTKRLMEAHRGRVHPRPPKLTPILGSRRSSRSNKGQHRYKTRLDL